MVNSKLTVAVFLMAICAVSLEAQSLGDIARAERARRQTETRQFSDEEINLAMQVPVAWDVKPGQGGQILLTIECANFSEGQCSIWVRASALPKDKEAITDADRRAWDSGVYSGRDLRKVSSQNVFLAGYPAYQIDFAGSSSATRARISYVFARDAGWLYQFEFVTSGTSMEHFDEYVDRLQIMLNSLQPCRKLSSGEGVPGVAKDPRALASEKVRER